MYNSNLGAFIKEFRDNLTLSYIIEDERYFSQNNYQTLQNQMNNGFLKCVQLSQEGKIKLVYHIFNLKPLQSILPQLTAESFWTIISKVLNIVLELKSNGFLQVQNLNISFDKIFIDPNNLNVYLVYLPINIEADANSNFIFERKLKQNIIEAISRNPNLNSELTARLYQAITIGNQPLEVIIENLKFIGNPRTFATHRPKNPMYNTSYGRPPQPTFNMQQNRGQVYNSTKPYISMPQAMNGQYKSGKLNEISVKKIFLVLCQILSLISLMIVLLAFDFNASINIGITLIILALDLIITNLIITFLGNDEKKPNAPYVTNSNISLNNMNFQYKDDGGVTEVLDDSFTPSIALVGENTPVNITLIINKAEFKIGKKAEMVDGVISFNKAISRVHCKITCVNNNYYITDIGSANGTYVNGLKVPVDNQVPITVGDKIRLAKSEFVVKAV